ncbi:unnamed protein product [Orchesella dallaii]|uniref:Kazal-like domain-containing protein n=1 Tax=Orchesella dallaii TaxID=48710 RepID=A0ABP1RAJ0_9HEXA
MYRMEYSGLFVLLFLSILIAETHGGALDNILQPKDKKGQCEYCAKEPSKPTFGLNGKEYKNECFRKCTEGNLPSVKMKTSTYSDSDEGFSSEEPFSSEEERPQRRRGRKNNGGKKKHDKNERGKKQPKKSIQFHREMKPASPGLAGRNESTRSKTENGLRGNETLLQTAAADANNETGGLNIAPSVGIGKSQENGLSTSANKGRIATDANGDLRSKTIPQAGLGSAQNILQDALGPSNIFSSWNPFGELASFG